MAMNLRVISVSAVLATLLAALALAGCATSYDKRGVYHVVRSGESIQRIAKIYGTDLQGIAEYNNILNPDDIQPGMKLYIPPQKKKPIFKQLPFGEAAVGKKSAASKGKGSEEDTKPIQIYRGRFVWPVEGKVLSLFGVRNGRKHDGIDISAQDGTPIKAAAAGKVVFAGTMRGYGNLILLRHKDNLFTAYSHNSVNKVRKGQMVKQGDVIGKVGHTGRATGSHLHFEIRHGQTARNPLFFLPSRDGSGKALKSRNKADDLETQSDESSEDQNVDMKAENKKESLKTIKQKSKKQTKSKSKGKKDAKKSTTKKKGKRNGTNVQKTH